MNAKLVRIGLQSGMLNYVDNETPPEYFIASWATEVELQEFAELIVRECVTICESGSNTQMTSSGAAEKIRLLFDIK